MSLHFSAATGAFQTESARSLGQRGRSHWDDLGVGRYRFSISWVGNLLGPHHRRRIPEHEIQTPASPGSELSEAERTSAPLLRGRFTVAETSSTDRPRRLMRQMTMRSPSSASSSNRLIPRACFAGLAAGSCAREYFSLGPSTDECIEVGLCILPGGSGSRASQDAKLLHGKGTGFSSDPQP